MERGGRRRERLPLRGPRRAGARVSADGGGGDDCDACSRWEGRLVSITGATKGLPSLADAEADGLFHPNCIHRLEYVDEDELPELMRQQGAGEPQETEGCSSGDGGGPPQWSPQTPLERDTDALMQSIGATHTDGDLPLSGANPHYADGPEYQNNCQRCVPAAEARRRGYDVEAKPSDGNSNGARFWKDGRRDKHYCGGGTNFQRDAESEMSQAPDGSRFLVRIAWADGGAHFFMAEKTPNGIRYTNPQNPATNAVEYFNNAATDQNKNWILRIDNREFTADAQDAFQPRRGTS